MYELSQGLLYELRLKFLGNEEPLVKSLKSLDLPASTQPTSQKANLDTFAKKSRKSSC